MSRIQTRDQIIKGRPTQISYPPPPIRARRSFFPNVKNNVLVRITETSNNDYNNAENDSCDYSLGIFDDFCDQKLVKKGQIIRTRPRPFF